MINRNSEGIDGDVRLKLDLVVRKEANRGITILDVAFKNRKVALGDARAVKLESTTD